MHALVQVVGIVNLVAFAGLAAIAIRQWRRRRDTAAAWVALSLAALAFVATIGRLLPTHPHGFSEGALARVELAVLVLFPYLLYRFTTAFREAPGILQRFVNVMTSIMVVWSFALPRLPATGEHRPA